jgi:hypothetical protein
MTLPLESPSARVASALLLLLLLASACARQPLPVCPGEGSATNASGAAAVPKARSVADATAGGVLHGTPQGKDRPKKMILMIDYSGSMYGGYGKERVPGCGRCKSGLVAGRPRRDAGGQPPQPYYVGTPEFKDLVARWLVAAAPATGDLGLEILLFNGRIFRLGESGPEPIGAPLRFERRLTRTASAAVDGWLRQIPGNPYQVDPRAPNTTETPTALRSVLAAIDDEAIVWLITDNIVDTEGGAGGVAADPDTARTAEFYRQLQEEPRVQMIVAYPIFRAEPCSWMCNTSLFTYGLYLSRFERPASSEFHRLGGTRPNDGRPVADGLLWNTELQQLAAEYSGRAADVGRRDLAGVPLRLKPIDTEALSIGFGRPALRCAHAEFGEKLRCLAHIEIRNTLRHQTVETAKLTLSNETLAPHAERDGHRLVWAAAVCPGQLRTLAWQVRGGRRGTASEPIEIGPLKPLARLAVDVSFELPAVAVDTSRRASLWEVATTGHIVLDGLLKAELRDFHTSLEIDQANFASVYGSAELPAIFRTGEVGSATATYRIDASLANDGQALALLLLLGGGSFAAICTLIVMRFQRRQYTVVVDGIESARLSLPRLSRRDLEVAGSPCAALVRGWGSGYKVVPRRGVRLRRDGPAWVLRVGGESGEEHRVEIRRGWSASRQRSQIGDRMDNW